MSIQQPLFSDYLRQANQDLTRSKREKIYYHLIRANLREMLANVYARVIQQLGDAKWTFLIDQFLQLHSAKTPYFYQLPDEFLSFLWHNSGLYQECPWVFALAHFEWMELVATVADRPLVEQGTVNLAAESVIQCSPLAYYCQYEYAVYPLDKGAPPLALRATPWQGIVYRDNAEQVYWHELAPWTALLFNRIQQQSENTVAALIAAMSLQAKQEEIETISHSIDAWCNEWQRLGILL
jgi:hypothetical protein